MPWPIHLRRGVSQPTRLTLCCRPRPQFQFTVLPIHLYRPASGGGGGRPDQDQAYGSWSVPYYHPTVQYTDDHRSNGAIDQPWQNFNDAQSALTAVKCTSLSGSISTISTGLNRICVGMHGRGALPSPVLAVDWPMWC